MATKPEVGFGEELATDPIQPEPNNDASHSIDDREKQNLCHCFAADDQHEYLDESPGIDFSAFPQKATCTNHDNGQNQSMPAVNQSRR